MLMVFCIDIKSIIERRRGESYVQGTRKLYSISLLVRSAREKENQRLRVYWYQVILIELTTQAKIQVVCILKYDS